MAGRRDPALRRLGRQRLLARLALWWEEVWPRAWPPLGVAGVFLVLVFGGLFLAVPLALHLVLLAGFLVALCGAFWLGFRGYRTPSRQDAERRLEHVSGLTHRPLAALSDTPSSKDPAALALWEAHQARMAARLANLRVGKPQPNLAGRDPKALRLGLIVALVASLGIAGGEAPERLRRAFIPQLGPGPAPIPLRIEAWATPPAYTGAAPVLLDAAGGNVSLPTGSRLQVSLSGASGDTPKLLLDQAETAFTPLDAGAWTSQLTLERSGRLTIQRGGGQIAAWVLDIRPDTPPTVAWAEPPGRAPRGPALRLPWRVKDDYGVTSLKAEITLTARPAAPPLVVDIPAPANAREADGVAQPDLSAHVWAGLPVRVRLVAQDGAGQQGSSDTVETVIPERVFNHPVAKLIIAIRRDLSVDPGAREQARRDLDVVSVDPAAYENDLPTFMALRAARARLLRDRRPEAVAEVQSMLWDTAVALEEGRAERTARALAEAKEALRQALQESERARQEGEASANQTPEQRAAEEAKRREAERRVQELREAIRRHMEALAERLRQENGQNERSDSQQRQMDRREVERRTDRMEQAAREGRNQDAERELAELERMLQQMEQGRMAGRDSPERQQRRERGQQQMGVMQDMVRRESQMLDRSHQREQAEEQRQNQQRRTPRSPYMPPDENAQRQQQQRQQASEEDARARNQDAARQNALRRALGEVMQQFGDLTGEIPAPLGRADQAMREAQEALRNGADPRPSQERAIRELTEGSRQMAQAMRQQFGQQPGQQEPGEGEGEGEGEGMADGQQQGGEGQDRENAQGPGRDPLGRPAREAPGQAENGGDTRVPEEAEQLRTRRIQEELRRRGAEKERPPAELDYIDRLLKQF
ncbi:DUF4175 family protein [Acetobacteraceae bacterium H6797]|nr:DUF4175 family protein [Acetobacteraceae bacterium H6797]